MQKGTTTGPMGNLQAKGQTRTSKEAGRRETCFQGCHLVFLAQSIPSSDIVESRVSIVGITVLVRASIPHTGI